MFTSLRKTIGIAGLSAAMAFGAVSTAAAQDDTITFGWTAWADAEFVTKLAAELIEKNYDHEVKLTLSAIALQYQGVANGDLDGMLMAWLPDTHAAYWKRFKDDVVDLGPLYENAKLGWVVPSYVPKDKLASIEDLKDPQIREKLNGIIQGIDPGAGLMQLSEDTLKAYGLEQYTLRSASGAAMTAALSRAIENKEWIVVTGWTPHWMFGRWDLRFLDDPKGSLGAAQHINILVRQGFKEDYPEVAAFLKRMHIPLDELQAAMYEAQQTSYEQAIAKYIEEHQKRIAKWLGESATTTASN